MERSSDGRCGTEDEEDHDVEVCNDPFYDGHVGGHVAHNHTCPSSSGYASDATTGRDLGDESDGEDAGSKHATGTSRTTAAPTPFLKREHCCARDKSFNTHMHLSPFISTTYSNQNPTGVLILHGLQSKEEKIKKKNPEKKEKKGTRSSVTCSC